MKKATNHPIATSAAAAHAGQPATPSPGYERRDASLLAIASIAGSMILLIGATLVVAKLYLVSPYRNAAAEGRQSSFTDGAAWKTSVENDQTALKAEQVRHLDTYGWMDRQKGVVRIPISRAMELEVADASSGQAERSRR